MCLRENPGRLMINKKSRKGKVAEKDKGFVTTLTGGFISLIFMIMDFLACHDIYKESGEFNAIGEWMN